MKNLKLMALILTLVMVAGLLPVINVSADTAVIGNLQLLSEYRVKRLYPIETGSSQVINESNIRLSGNNKDTDGNGNLIGNADMKAPLIMKYVIPANMIDLDQDNDGTDEYILNKAYFLVPRTKTDLSNDYKDGRTLNFYDISDNDITVELEKPIANGGYTQYNAPPEGLVTTRFATSTLKQANELYNAEWDAGNSTIKSDTIYANDMFAFDLTEYVNGKLNTVDSKGNLTISYMMNLAADASLTVAAEGKPLENKGVSKLKMYIELAKKPVVSIADWSRGTNQEPFITVSSVAGDGTTAVVPELYIDDVKIDVAPEVSGNNYTFALTDVYGNHTVKVVATDADGVSSELVQEVKFAAKEVIGNLQLLSEYRVKRLYPISDTTSQVLNESNIRLSGFNYDTDTHGNLADTNNDGVVTLKAPLIMKYVIPANMIDLDQDNDGTDEYILNKAYFLVPRTKTELGDDYKDNRTLNFYDISDNDITVELDEPIVNGSNTQYNAPPKGLVTTRFATSTLKQANELYNAEWAAGNSTIKSDTIYANEMFAFDLTDYVNDKLNTVDSEGNLTISYMMNLAADASLTVAAEGVPLENRGVSKLKMYIELAKKPEMTYTVKNGEAVINSAEELAATAAFTVEVANADVTDGSLLGFAAFNKTTGKLETIKLGMFSGGAAAATLADNVDGANMNFKVFIWNMNGYVPLKAVVSDSSGLFN